MKGARVGLEAMPLDVKDRASLTYLMSAHDDQFNSFVGGIQLRQARLMAHEHIVSTLPDDVTAATIAGLHGNLQESQQLTSDIQDRLEHGLTSGALSRSEYDRAIEFLHAKHDQAQQLMQTLSPDNFTPEGYHAAQAFGFEKSVAPAVKNTIVQHHTQWFYDYHSRDTTYRDFMADAQQGKININAYLNFTPMQAQEARLQLQGIVIAKGAIESGQSYPQLQQRMTEIEKNPAPTLSEQAELNHYKIYSEKLTVDFPDAMADTVLGRQARQQYNAHVANIEDSGVLSPEAKAQQLQEAKQQYYKSLVNGALAMGMPPKLIKPIPQGVMRKAESGFTLNADPTVTTDFIKQHAAMGVWMAASASTPRRQEIFNLGWLLMNTPYYKLLAPMISANQVGRDHSNVKVKNNNILDVIEDKGMSTILGHTATRDALNFIAQQPNGAARVQALKGVIRNTLLFHGGANNDYSLAHLSDYQAKIDSMMKAAYPIIKDHAFTSPGHYGFNTRTIPVSKMQAEALSGYIFRVALPDKAKQYASSEMKKHGWVDRMIHHNLSMDPFYLTNTPDGRLVVINQNTGETVYSERFTHHLLQSASAWYKTIFPLKEDAKTFDPLRDGDIVQ
ncbi:hypothetical protein [Candidiatus Paracoxiella cheracis]|uniref:hypothetical protein n=1 Tax=Candidiatus Paracoxiella cheracis TaxID=3405120 RepID=UPI003BF57C9E